MSQPPAVSLAAHLAAVQARIAVAARRAGRDPASITLCAVTKTVPPDVISMAAAVGVAVCGENRVQEARAKIAALPGLRWELIGPLQANKIRAAVALFARLQTVADADQARQIARAATDRGIILPVLIQVNVAGEPTKHGVAPAAVVPLAEVVAALPGLRGEGLMTVAPVADDPDAVRPVFAQLRALRDAVQARVPGDWATLSMGMSDDFEAAIAEGATLVRIGRALFGERSVQR